MVDNGLYRGGVIGCSVRNNSTGTAYTVQPTIAGGDIVFNFQTLAGATQVFSDITDTKTIGFLWSWWNTRSG